MLGFTDVGVCCDVRRISSVSFVSGSVVIASWLTGLWCGAEEPSFLVSDSYSRKHGISSSIGIVVPLREGSLDKASVC